MNKMLVAVFDNEAAAQAGLYALRALHSDGEITLYATGMIGKDGQGLVSVKECAGKEPLGTGVGLAVGSLIGLLGGPIGLAVGAVTGTLAGAIRDFWVAGVGLDFVEETGQHLLPHKVAVVAEIEEEWITPVDTAMAAAGGLVFRRTRSNVVESQFNHDMRAFKAEIKDLEAEAEYASGSAKARLEAKIGASKLSLDVATERAQQWVESLKGEAASKATALQTQLTLARGEAKARVEQRVKHVQSAYHARGAKLAQAWGLTKQALAP
jgi:uncharacterized membrane protein